MVHVILGIPNRRLWLAGISVVALVIGASLLPLTPTSLSANAQPCRQGASRPDLVDGVNPAACSQASPAISHLRMSPSSRGLGRDHFPNGSQEIYISFDYENMTVNDSAHLLVRDENGISFLDHTFRNLTGSGSTQIVVTGRDAVDGLARSGLEAGNQVASHAERALQAGSRFSLAPDVERAVVAATVLQDAVRSLAEFPLGDDAEAHLAQAQSHIGAALEAGQAVLKPDNDLEAMKGLVRIIRDEARLTTLDVAEAHAVVLDTALAFPDTVDCRFYLTNVYLNEFPVDSIEWTVGAPGPPARIHPPEETRRSGVLHITPLTIYTQEVAPSDAPHETTISGRIVDGDCRPVADGTRVALSLDDPTLGSLVPEVATTSNGYFASSLHASDELGGGLLTVRAAAGGVEGEGVALLVGPPARIQVEPAADSISTGASTAVGVQVRDALGRAVADGTSVAFAVSPPDAGVVTPSEAETASGFASVVFEAGNQAGAATIRVRAGDVEASTVIEIAGSTGSPTPSPTPTATPTPTCDRSDPEQLCGGLVTVRVFEDPRCDGRFDDGLDRPLIDVPVSLVYPDGTTVRLRTDASGYARFSQVQLHGDERVAIRVEYPEELVEAGLTTCDNSGTLKSLGRGEFGAFSTAAVTFRAHREIVERRLVRP